MIVRMCLPILFLLPLAACEDETQFRETTEREEELATGDGRLLLFDCPTGGVLEAHFRDEAVQFSWGGQTVRLPEARSGSGARYAEGEAEFWNKGKEVSVRLPGREPVTCVQMDNAIPRNPSLNPTESPS